MLQYKIPQNVQVEDKIFGNILTLRELITLMVGGGITYVLYTVFARTYVIGTIATGIICIPFLLSCGFAFIKINDISLLKYCILLLEFILKPQKRVWNKSGDIVLTISSTPPKKVISEKTVEKNQETDIENLKKISKILNLGELREEQGRGKIYGENSRR